MVGAAPDRLDRALSRGRYRLVAFEDLGVAEHRIERRAQFVAQAHHVAALRTVGGFRSLFGVLQGRVGLLVGGDLFQESRILPGGFLFRNDAAVMTDAETAETAILLKEIAKTRSVVVVEHDMGFIRDLGVKVTCLAEGSVLAEGSIDFVSNDPKVIENYLGR